MGLPFPYNPPHLDSARTSCQPQRRCPHITPNMPNSSCSNPAPPRQSFSQGRRHGYTFSKTRSDVPTTVIHPQSNLPTPTTSISGRESRNNGSHGPSGAISPRASPRQMPKRLVASMQGFRDVCEWVSKVEPGRSASEDQDYESTSGWVHPSGGEPPTAQAHLSPPKAPRSGASELDPAHIFGGVVDELTGTAVEKFGSMSLSSSRKRSISQGPEKCHKRSRLGPCQDPASAGSISDFEERDTVLAEHLGKAAPRIWPCPFFVRDRASYLSCWTRHCLLSVGDVREHLCTAHLEPIHCSVCYETFPTVRLRDTHMRSQECHFQLPVVFDGLRDSQVRDLGRQVTAEDKAPGLQARQWVKMWCIVFSCTQLPPSPFYFSQQELAVYEFRRFWARHGEHIIANVLAKHRLRQYKIENEERSLQALSSLVADRAVDRLLLSQDT
ncbi:hypothetical protein F5883DRAFT_554178 [Diaporthe sp. PMI_573]|nr:hypothetical protein F5883DRAFT_554178 [Diaporthaceae sp. PMI_573]